MTNDRRRTDAYVESLRAKITPDSVVLDIGAGAGMLTLLACQAGARKVYAVESEAVIEVARDIVADNGFTDRVEFIQGLSTAIDLPEKVDVIVSDIHGVLPFFMGSLASIIDARDRFLNPGGSIIPSREKVWVAPVSDAAQYERLVSPWEGTYGVDGSAGRQRVVNTWSKVQAASAPLLAKPQVWADLDYSTLQSVNAGSQCNFEVSTPGEAHGLLLWFDSETSPGVGFSNSPDCGRVSLYHRAFFPWPAPVKLEVGDLVDVRMRADFVSEDYIYGWDTEIRKVGAGAPDPINFRQSSFLGNSLSADWLRKTGASFRPQPNDESRIDRTILESFFAGSSLEEISRDVASRFPERFPNWRKALTRVAELSMRYSL
jgi:protein arginine N-methyltransferase 1